MKKEELIKRYCRFYKGEDEFNGDYNILFYWEAEEVFIRHYGTRDSEETVRFYKNCGLEGATDEIPLELAATLFVVYCHGADYDPMELVESFKKKFLAKYLDHPR